MQAELIAAQTRALELEGALGATHQRVAALEEAAEAQQREEEGRRNAEREVAAAEQFAAAAAWEQEVG